MIVDFTGSNVFTLPPETEEEKEEMKKYFQHVDDMIQDGENHKKNSKIKYGVTPLPGEPGWEKYYKKIGN